MNQALRLPLESFLVLSLTCYCTKSREGELCLYLDPKKHPMARRLFLMKELTKVEYVPEEAPVLYLVLMRLGTNNTLWYQAPFSVKP